MQLPSPPPPIASSTTYFGMFSPHALNFHKPTESKKQSRKANPIYAKTLSPKCMLTRAATSIFAASSHTRSVPGINFKVIGNGLLGSCVDAVVSGAERRREERMRARGSRAKWRRQKKKILFHFDNPDLLPFKHTLAGKAFSGMLK
jgi:hypothetical protein